MRVIVLCPDLLFGSKLEGALGAAGHEVERVAGVGEARARTRASADLLVVDLTVPETDGPALVAAMRAAGELERVPALGFYAHVEQDVRERAERAGFDRVVPRSRMAREAVALCEGLIAARSGSG